MIKEKATVVIVFFLCLAGLVGCATTKGDWQKTTQLNTVDAYDNFLVKHPQSEFTNLARWKIEELEWQNVINTNNMVGYQKFLEKYPRGKFSIQAREKIEALEWQNAKLTNTMEAYRLFLKKYSRSSYANEAYIALDMIAWKEAEKLNDRSGYQQYLQNFPKGKHTDDASAMLEKIDFEDALSLNTIAAIDSFIERHANGKLIEEAKAKRENLYAQRSIRKTSLTLSDIQIGKYFSAADVTISQSKPGGALKVTGKYETILGGGSNLFGLGARHRFVGKVEMQGLGLENYVFIGNEADPLTFVVQGNGYTFAGGKGFVIIKKTGEIIRLGF